MTVDLPPPGFPPIVGEAPIALILGSFPGTASLEAGQYYAHRRNRFWPLLATVTGVDAAAPYAERVAGATRAGLAIWDVLDRCVRPGSLDANIVRASEVPNDLAGLLARHPSILAIGFNGRAAATFFERHIPSHWKGRTPPSRFTLPSTSPANAAFSLDALRRAWAPLLDRLRRRP